MSTVMTTSSRAADSEQPVFNGIIPASAASPAAPGETFELTPTTRIAVDSDDAKPTAVAERFATWLRARPDCRCPSAAKPAGDVVLTTATVRRLGRRGLHAVGPVSGVQHRRRHAGGSVPGVDDPASAAPARRRGDDAQPGPWTVAGAEISDRPRFEYRGTMLDVARHFFPVDDVLRHIEVAALYKINVLHLHLTDDQGWRLTVPGWPRLTGVGGASDIEGGPGGSYTPPTSPASSSMPPSTSSRSSPRSRARRRVRRPDRLSGADL